MNHCLILENIRSAYNVWTLVRTADALWRDVIISWFSPDPRTQEKVKKTSLGAEESVHIEWFWHCTEAIDHAKEQWYTVVAAELTDGAVDFGDWVKSCVPSKPIALVLGNEVEGVTEDTLWRVDVACFIPMQWVKESMNVAQVGAMMMWGIDA